MGSLYHSVERNMSTTSNMEYNITELPRDPEIPDLLNGKIVKLILDTHPNPKLFWYSQFARYAMRPNLRIQKIIEVSIKKCEFFHPIVGIQIRRGNKLIVEATYHSNDEYMFHVSNYYDKLSLKGYNGAKNVFIASDDSSAVNDLRKHYTDYHFISSECFAVSNNSDDNPDLDYIMLDIHFLSMCDFIVCTLSSNVCRLSYEIMVSTKSGFTSAVKSLDLPWFVWLDSGKVHREFRYQHKTNSTTLSVNETVAERYFWSNAAQKRGKIGFVECMTETSNFTLLCPLYKTKVKLHV